LWITTVDAMLEDCLSVYEHRFLQISAADFGDGGQAANAISLLLLEDTTCRTSIGTCSQRCDPLTRWQVQLI
jgi:hypothetical protein